MKTIWIIIFSVLGFMNCLKLFKDLYRTYRNEKNKYNDKDSCHEKCYYIKENSYCDFLIAKEYWKRKGFDTKCKGASECQFYLNKDKHTGEIKHSNMFHTITNTIYSSIGTITILILSVFEVYEKLK